MNNEGYQKLTSVLAGYENITITPQPADDDTEHVRFVTVDFSGEVTREITPDAILNALGKASLVNRRMTRSMGVNNDPNLTVIGMLPGSITFEDTNIPLNIKLAY